MLASVEFREETLEPTGDSAVFKEGPGFGLEFWVCGLGCGVWDSGLAEFWGDCRGRPGIVPFNRFRRLSNCTSACLPKGL